MKSPDVSVYEHAVNAPSKPSKDLIFTDLPRAEDMIFRRAFALFDDQRAGIIPQTHVLMRAYVLEHSTIKEDVRLDAEISRSASNIKHRVHFIDIQGFTDLMRKHCLGDNDAVTRWARVSKSRVTIDVIECREALGEFFRVDLGLSDHETPTMLSSEALLDTVMAGCGVTVLREEWFRLIERAARMVRALRQWQCL